MVIVFRAYNRVVSNEKIMRFLIECLESRRFCCLEKKRLATGGGTHQLIFVSLQQQQQQ